MFNDFIAISEFLNGRYYFYIKKPLLKLSMIELVMVFQGVNLLKPLIV